MHPTFGNRAYTATALSMKEILQKSVLNTYEFLLKKQLYIISKSLFFNLSCGMVDKVLKSHMS